MRKTSKFKTALVLFLLAILLLGGSAAVSITAAEILFVAAIVILAGIMILAGISSHSNKKTK